MIPATTRQLEVLSIIERYAAERGYPPTVRELAQRLGFKSLNGAADHLAALKRKGLLAWTPGMSRTYVVTLEGLQALRKAEAEA